MTEATVGYSSHGAIYGFKLHAVSSTAGMIVKLAITPVHQADVTVARVPSESLGTHAHPRR